MKAVQSTVHAIAGQEVNISCDVWADPAPILQWFKGTNSLSVPFANDKFQQIVRNSKYCAAMKDCLLQTLNGALRFSLTIVPQSESDVTNYTCVARNKIGEGKSTVYLTGIVFMIWVLCEVFSSKVSHLLHLCPQGNYPQASILIFSLGILSHSQISLLTTSCTGSFQ